MKTMLTPVVTLAGAWMFNGGLQILQTGIVPGNRNADNIDEVLKQYECLVYPTTTIRKTGGVKAFMLTSFGFGQKGGIAIAIAPKYLFAAITEEEYTSYCARVIERQNAANTGFIKGMIENRLFKAKDRSPWAPKDESQVFLDPLSRASQQDKETVTFDSSNLHPSSAIDTQEAPSSTPTILDFHQPSQFAGVADSFLQTAAAGNESSTNSVGVDIESTANINIDNESFVERNFTSTETIQCYASANPQHSFAGRWSAKEAVFKALKVKSRGGGSAMRDIEILSEHGGPPKVLVSLDPLP